MGREVRRVPADWEHPRGDNGRHIPLLGRSFSKTLAAWRDGKAKWAEGLRDDWNGGWQPLSDTERAMTFEEWSGREPQPHQYMPDWSDEHRTHFQMYEDTSEGTPISPVMESPEALARWLVDNSASAFAGQTASYEAWLRMCQGGYAPSAVMDHRGLQSGVQALA